MKNNLPTNLFVTGMLLTTLVGWDVAHTPTPVVKAEAVVASPVASPKPLETIETPETYIVKVFGEVDGERAIKMLKECENKQMRLDAINWNGNGTNDFGLFQINSLHGYTHDQLKDYKFNTNVAYKIYKNAGYSFSPWTCSYQVGDKSFWQ
jgi:hypothetical protein